MRNKENKKRVQNERKEKDTYEFKFSKQVNTVATTAVEAGVETLLTAARFQVHLQMLIDCGST